MPQEPELTKEEYAEAARCGDTEPFLRHLERTAAYEELRTKLEARAEELKLRWTEAAKSGRVNVRLIAGAQRYEVQRTLELLAATPEGTPHE